MRTLPTRRGIASAISWGLGGTVGDLYMLCLHGVPRGACRQPLCARIVVHDVPLDLRYFVQRFPCHMSDLFHQIWLFGFVVVVILRCRRFRLPCHHFWHVLCIIRDLGGCVLLGQTSLLCSGLPCRSRLVAVLNDTHAGRLFAVLCDILAGLDRLYQRPSAACPRHTLCPVVFVMRLWSV